MFTEFGCSKKIYFKKNIIQPHNQINRTLKASALINSIKKQFKSLRENVTKVLIES